MISNPEINKNKIKEKKKKLIDFKENNEQPIVNSEFIYIEEKYLDNSVYKGQKLNNQRNGKGTFIYSDGGSYDGFWFENKMHGFGKLFYEDNSLAYEGNWFEDHFQGKGILYNENKSIDFKGDNFDYKNLDTIGNFWIRFDGMFKKDKKEGKGQWMLSNGEVISGIFKNDKLEGYGVFIKKNGEFIFGRWKKNHLLSN